MGRSHRRLETGRRPQIVKRRAHTGREQYAQLAARVARGPYGLSLGVPSGTIPVNYAPYAFRRRPGWRWKEGGRWHRVPGKLFDSNPILYLTDVHSSVFRLAWCLIESTRTRGSPSKPSHTRPVRLKNPQSFGEIRNEQTASTGSNTR